MNRDVFGDYSIEINNEDYDLSLRQAGDFMLYFSSEQTGEIRRMVKARDIWDQFSQLAFCNILVGTVPVTDATRSKISTPKLEWKICGRPLEWWQESSKRPPEA